MYKRLHHDIDELLDGLQDHLAQVFGIDEDEMAEQFMLYFSPEEEEEEEEEEEDDHEEEEEEEEPSSPSTKAAPKKMKQTTLKKTSVKSKEVEEKRTCEKEKKDGTLCGKTAKNEIDDKWYCGTEKSGCYKSIVSSKAKVGVKKKASKSKAAMDEPETDDENDAGTTTKQPKRGPEAMLNKMRANVLSRTGTFVTKKVTINEVDLHLHEETGIVIDKDRALALGMYNEKTKDIDPLTADAKTWLEEKHMRYTHEPVEDADEVDAVGEDDEAEAEEDEDEEDAEAGEDDMLNID